MSEIDEKEPVTVENMTRHINTGWDELQTFIASLTPAQMTQPADAAGWTVKDHLIHLALWQDGISALLVGESRAAGMEISQTLWDSEADTDTINAEMQLTHKDIHLDEVLIRLQKSREKLLAALGKMKDEDLMLPYQHFDKNRVRDYPIFAYIVGNSFEHYREHIPWMQAIVSE